VGNLGDWSELRILVNRVADLETLGSNPEVDDLTSTEHKNNLTCVDEAILLKLRRNDNMDHSFFMLFVPHHNG
jgi:hypothetical protein